MSKEEIKARIDSGVEGDYWGDQWIQMAELCRKQEKEIKELREALDGNAVEFCDWVRKNNYSQGVRFGLWGVDTDSTDIKVYTTSELYQKFIVKDLL